MTLNEFSLQNPALIGVAGVISLVDVFIAHRSLRRLRVSDPGLLKSVGISEVDWGPAFVIGVFRLAFRRGRSPLSVAH